MTYQWSPCASGAAYTFAVDWNGDGNFNAGIFEGGLDGWIPGEGPAQLTRTTDNPHSGQYSLQIQWDTYDGTGTAPRAFKTFSNLTVGNAYTFTGWTYHTASGMPVYLGITSGPSSGAGYTNGAWQQLSVDFTATSTTHSLEIQPVTRPAGGATLNANPYFVTDASGWNANNSTIARSTAVLAPKALGTLLVTPNGISAAGGANADMTAAGTVIPGDNYSVECWVYSPAGWSDLRAAVDWYTSTGVFISSSLGSGTAVAAGVWTFLRQTFTAPATASRVVARVRHAGTPSSSDIYYAWGARVNDFTQLELTQVDDLILIDPSEDVTEDLLDQGITIEYGRDQDRQLSPGAVGRMAFTLCNASRVYSPENADSPLYGELEPARQVQATASYGGVDYPLFFGRIDDFDIHADRSDRSVSFTALDTLALLQGVNLSTALYEAKRTGEIVNLILDDIGWAGARDIDVGATFVRYWWSESDAFDALQEIVRSEGPPAIAYAAPDGTFIFRDRHHRILRDQSLTSQATFAAARVLCDAPAVTGFDYTPPFVYQHGWRDIVNSVALSVDERMPDPEFSVIWSTDTTFTISDGETVNVDVEAAEPFRDAQDLDENDILWNSSTVDLSITLSRTSGQTLRISIMAIGGTAIITYMQVRARSVPVTRTIKVLQEDSTSIAAHGRRTYPDTVPWANLSDAQAVAGIILAHYAQRRPLVQMRVVSQDPAHLLQVLTRTVSDRITIRNDELGMNTDFFVEQISHTIQRINPDSGPVHAVVLGCERQLLGTSGNPFTFDKAGAGFNDGVFDAQFTDNPVSVFIFDDATQGQFDVGRFGT